MTEGDTTCSSAQDEDDEERICLDEPGDHTRSQDKGHSRPPTHPLTSSHCMDTTASSQPPSHRVLRGFAHKCISDVSLKMEKLSPTLLSHARYCSEPLFNTGGKVLDCLDGHLDRALESSTKRLSEFFNLLLEKQIISQTRYDIWSNCTVQIAADLLQQGFMDSIRVYLLQPRNALIGQIKRVLAAINNAVRLYLRSVRPVLSWLVDSFFQVLEEVDRIQPWAVQLVRDLSQHVNFASALTKDGVHNMDILECVEEPTPDSADAMHKDPLQQEEEQDELYRKRLSLLSHMRAIAFKTLESNDNLLGCLVHTLILRLYQDSLVSIHTLKQWLPFRDKMAEVLEDNGCTNTGLFHFITAETLDLRKHQFVAQLSSIASRYPQNIVQRPQPFHYEGAPTAMTDGDDRRR